MLVSVAGMGIFIGIVRMEMVTQSRINVGRGGSRTNSGLQDWALVLGRGLPLSLPLGGDGLLKTASGSPSLLLRPEPTHPLRAISINVRPT